MKPILMLALIALASLLGSCTPALQCGDARVARIGSGFPFAIKIEGFDLTLPAASLARKGATEFDVSALPAHRHYYYFSELAGGSRYRDGYSPPEASHQSTRVAIQFIATNGAVLFQREEQLGSLKWGRTGSVMHNSSFLPSFGSSSPLLTATAYRVRITVLEPSKTPKETLRITAVSPDEVVLY